MTGPCWPTVEQTRLLRAALLGGEEGRPALDEWRRTVDLDRLDRASKRLLPLLYSPLLAENPQDPLLRQLREVCEGTVAKNRAVVQATVDLSHVLREAGIDTCLLKGVALIARGLMPLGSRSMADGDVLVPSSQALTARDALVANGWRPEGRLDAALLTVRHAVPFRSPSGQQVDLHWHVLGECCTEEADAGFWQAAEPATLDGTPARTLCAADLLLHACVHGLTWSIVPPIRWVSDAVMVVRGAEAPVDWERLVRQAEQHVLVLPLTDALRYLRETFDLPIPESVITRMSHTAVPRWAAAEYRAILQPRTVQRQILYHWCRHRRLSASGSVLSDLIRMPVYLGRRWQWQTSAAAQNRNRA